ncbi:outer membrane protein assembly factor BamB family protein [Luteimonas sp. A501]
MSNRWHHTTAAGIFLLLSLGVAFAGRSDKMLASVSAVQVEQGAVLYEQYCGACHGRNLSDGVHAPPLKGDGFRIHWSGHTAAELLEYTSTTMPPRMASMIPLQAHADIVAYLLAENGIAVGERSLPADLNALATQTLPDWPRYASGGGLAPDIAVPPAPPSRDVWAGYRDVDDTLLASPPDADWLDWRRTRDAHGYSPLRQVDASNVSQLQLAWSWTLPQGPNAATPLVHDGVMFVHGHGDKLQALDAASGSLLWQYGRRLRAGVAASHKRSIALYGAHVIVATSDGQVAAIDARSGTVAWERLVGSPDEGIQLIGGPLVARGVVMMGTSGRLPGGNYIVGLDARNGHERWRFDVIQRPGEAIDTWNGIALEQRNGGSVWMPGSFDPVRGVAYFAPANTYDTQPLLARVDRSGVTNEGLYLNSTLALDPLTGRKVWHYQHQANDQFDLDWAFERQTMTLEVAGRREEVVLTAGKAMIFDLLRASDGRYLASFDLGLQNAVEAIDPVTGAKQVDARLLPTSGQTRTVCPHVSGGRSWLPTTYAADRRTLVVPITEACMDLVPAAPGEATILSTGVRWTVRPRPGSDGLYGRLQALDPQTGDTRWRVRERAPFTAGTLATAGGLVFAGSLDRWFKAYDLGTGEKRWEARLNDVPSAPPITYAVDGVQYVAVVVGPGGYQSMSYGALVPDIRNPDDAGTMLWVFALPCANRGYPGQQATRCN